jgi:hypothetical protein
MSLEIRGKRRIATLPIYRADRVYIGGRDVTPRVRGLYDGKKIVLTKYALRGKTIHHEEAHAIDDLRHGHIVESHARAIGFGKTKRIGTIGFSLLKRPHPRGCQCPYHEGHKRKTPATKGIGQAPGYRFKGGKTGFFEGPIHGL